MKKIESGRSMVEMLGVLAIIGVLSIGGMWGYQKAMTLYRTNNLIEDVRLAGFVVMDSLFDILPDDDTGMDMAGIFDQKTPYQFTAFAEKENTFEIMTQDIPYPVCEEVKKRKVEWLEEIKANGIPNICNKDDINVVSFFFNTDLNGNTEQESEQCRTDDDCPEDRPYCRNGMCMKCKMGLELSNGRCVDCQSVGIVEGSYSHQASKQACALCPNRCWDENQGKCFLSEKSNAFNNNGVCDYSCPAGTTAVSSESNQYRGTNLCVPCPEADGHASFSTSLESCHSCGDRYIYSKNYGGTGFRCLGCDIQNASAAITTREECDRCPNRCWDENQNLCLLTTENSPFNNNGVCNWGGCPTGKIVSYSTLIDRTLLQCKSCPAVNSYLTYTTPEQCHLCGNGYMASGEYNTQLAACIGCFSPDNTFTRNYLTSKSECDRCSNWYFNESEEKCYRCPNGQKADNTGTGCIPE